MMRPPAIGLLVLAALLAVALPTDAAEAEFAEEVSVEDRQMEQLGAYRYVYRFFFPLYEVALYTEQGAGAEAVLEADAAFHLTFRYLRDIEKSIILKAADKMLDKNLSPQERDQIAARVDELNAAYRGVQEGDTSSLTYIPDQGTTLRINAEALFTVPGRDFARLYFKIWLGQEPLSKTLRDHLLGQI